MFTVLLVLTVDSSLSWMLDVANAAKVSTFLSCFNFLTVFASFFSLLLMMAQSNTLIHPFSQMARGPAPSMPFVLIPLGAIELIVLVTALTSLSALHPGCSSAQPPRRPWQLEGSKVGNLKLQRKKTIQKKKDSIDSTFNWFNDFGCGCGCSRNQAGFDPPVKSEGTSRSSDQCSFDVEVGIVSNSFKILKFDSEFDSPRLVLIKHNTFHRSPVVLSCSRGLFPLILQSS